ncbi:TPA: hypothetical protein ACPHWC_004667 [Pseudomonas aeruginosa]|uniref:Transcriptional regulator n=1 Tax=Pseudomonas aeruginosa TaxID=287 RepID=A0A0U3TDV7_PSEAI|nr:hypothetical protein [Pseudomonas aeruginosa]ALV76813.1 hypothetical protein AOY09_01750 [Pseudomonas aeruginosa]AXN25970.1 hypothetical protein CP913_14105 [Pseudomonas aeruginosa]EIU1653265.1 hypothetical protein [Pseudomonas aeruginosa]EKJ7124744.1 hypothetical protein [Pseudomonas aeruginosa]EKV9031958.1 hypothetical protein [Pseudomonas aeruginosa]
MELAAYIREIDRPKEASGNPLERYAERCGVTVGYMRIHVLYARKDPRFRLLRALARESEGKVSLAEVLQHFGVPTAETIWPIAA